MGSSTRLPMRLPVGTKYVLEGRGLFVRRYIEFPSGRRIQLATRKALTCTPCTRAAWQQISIAPDQNSAEADAPSLSKKLARVST